MRRKCNRKSTGVKTLIRHTPLTCIGCVRTCRSSNHQVKGVYHSKEKAVLCVRDQHKHATLPATFLERHSQLLTPFASSPTSYAECQSMRKSVILLNSYKEPIVPSGTSLSATEPALKCLGIISRVNPGRELCSRWCHLWLPNPVPEESHSHHTVAEGSGTACR